MVEMVELSALDSSSTTTTRSDTTAEDNSSFATTATATATSTATTTAPTEEIPDREMPLSFVAERHLEAIEGISCITQTWRMKERMKTVSVALVLCLNVGVDPPDVVKTQPCARLECWIDPMSLPPAKALEAIGTALQSQYERWQPRARYRQSLDPTAEDVKKLCSSLRRNAKEERMLFHYSGHGVPKPTKNGEIWVFNRTYTQYIPLSIYDLQTWMGAPSIYVFDCSNAGIIVESFKTFAMQHENEYEQQSAQGRCTSPAPPCYRNCIQLAACAKNQVLPMNPELPADLFTSCLTTPIKIALRWYVLQPTAKLVPKVTLELIDKIPGKITDRRTMLGELNWIFTAITDTIAWNTLPRDLFQKLFRQDLLVASLFRNFLLAERIMRSCDCTPISSPQLPSTYQHPMWSAWDLALDLSLGQLPAILHNDEPFEHLPFFEEQLTAFQVWLQLGSEERTPPEQLPIVLQVLLSQVHRMRALELLGKFLDLGPWAVNLALSVGIFPYVLKLLQSCAKELRPLLVFIWAKILAVDNTCQADLVRDGGHKYFLSVLQDMTVSNECRTQAVFVLACIVNEFRDGQEAALQGSLVSICLEQLNDSSPQLRQWVAICLGRLWDQYEKARWTGVRDNAHEKLYSLLHDPCPEVRAAAVYALGTFINSVAERSEHANTIDHSVVMTLVNNVNGDMSSLVRKELVKALQWFVLVFEHAFWNVANQEINVGQPPDVTRTPTGMGRVASRDRLKPSPSPNQMSESGDYTDSMRRAGSVSCLYTTGLTPTLSSHSGSLGTLPGLAYGSVYMKIWGALCYLETDPHPKVAKMCSIVMGYVRKHIRDQKDSGLGISSSLPPSPKGPSYIAGESPPSLHCTPSRSSTLNRRRMQQRIAEESEDREQSRRKPLVTTHFVEWSCKKFAQPMMKDKAEDVESAGYYEKDWRHLRNKQVRKDAVEERKKIYTRRLEHQLYTGKVSTVPTLLQFHPFEQQIAIAERDSFTVLDWGRGAKLTQYHYKSARNPNVKITAIEWINGHDLGMVMTGADDGSVKLWRMPNAGTRDISLVSAWQAFTDMAPPSFRLAGAGFSGVILAWEQSTQTVITSGETRIIRFWDAERELRAYDIPTGADSSITCLDSTFTATSREKLSSHISVCEEPNEKDDDDDGEGLKMGAFEKETDSERGPRMGLVVCGCGDGSVRLFDRRCSPNEAKVKTWLEHGGSVMGVQLRGSQVISASSQGDVCLYDVRRLDAISKVTVFPSHMTAFAAYRGSDIYACGSVNQNVNIYSISHGNLNSIRYYEGFMGYRVGAISSLAFHPHRVCLATGITDGTINIYGLENRR